MLDASIKKYQNRLLTSIQVIEELIDIAKDLIGSKLEAKALKLENYEYSFYSTVSDNQNARELIKKTNFVNL
jgi:type I restriction enzyme R subunit